MAVTRSEISNTSQSSSTIQALIPVLSSIFVMHPHGDSLGYLRVLIGRLSGRGDCETTSIVPGGFYD